MEQIGEVEYRPSPADKCKCTIGWVPNERLGGDHKMAPVSCRSYVALLEEKIRAMSSADSDWLDNVQKTLVGYSAESASWDSPDADPVADLKNWKARIEADHDAVASICYQCRTDNHYECSGICACGCRMCAAHGPGGECGFCNPLFR